MKLKVFAALAEDINNGWVWLPEGMVNERTTVRIKSLNSGQSVYCEALLIGANYVKRYNANDNTYQINDKLETIIVNEWYRKKLGIPKTQTETDFEIVEWDNPIGHLFACLQHPQIVVRLASELAIISVLLGIVGICIGINWASVANYIFSIAI